MTIKQNPFSFYDFLGYLTPGAVFLYAILLLLGHLAPGTTTIEFATDKLSFEKAEVYIPFVLLAYIAGHFLSFLSSITIEPYSIWAHGYPSKYLLGIPSQGYLHVDQNGSRLVRRIVFVLLGPISVFDWILGRMAGMRFYAKPLDNLLSEVLKQRIECLIENHAQIHKKEKYGTANQSDFFRYAYHYAVENAENHLPKMQNYVALYGFLRTLTFVLLILFWISVWHIISAPVSFLTAALVIAGSGSITFFMFMGFVKFYRRFSLEALMAMAVTYRCEKTHSPSATGRPR